MSKIVNAISAVILTALVLVGSQSTAFAYVHDPMMNPKTAEDIIVNPDAVYGYSPNPESKRLGSYANMAWNDEEIVGKARSERGAYFDSVKEMIDLADSLYAAGKDTETIARTVSAKRNEIRIASYANNPEGLAALYESNLKTYGNKEGPTADYLYAKYGSWVTVLQKAFSVNSGMDACLGFYDQHYALYKITGEVPVYQFAIGNLKVEDINSASASEIYSCIINNMEYSMKKDLRSALDLDTWHCFDEIMAALLKVKDTSTTFVWTEDNNRYTVTIPAGADIEPYMENGYVGIMKLYEVYNGTQLNKEDSLYAKNPCYK
ncbi:MAG: hypothetical protein K6A23_10135 [Butyrivibrio sp.]|nr:hypothetical protein [Butyrivibrio sp.]